jgi:hypothetical protein
MKKRIFSAIALGAIFCAGLALQSCSDTRTETTYSSEPGYAGEAPVETRTTTTYTTTDDHDSHDSVVGSTVHAAGTIIAAPFRLVGDALSIVF